MTSPQTWASALVPAALLVAGSIALGLRAPGSTASPDPVPAPVSGPLEPPARAAERVFFHALNHDSALRNEALDRLRGATMADRGNGRLNLLLGLCHLWIAAESDPALADTTEHAILAAHHLTVARRALPEDGRVVSWLSAVQFRLARSNGDEAGADEALRTLRSAVAVDPCFHAVAMGILRFDHARDSDAFREGLDAMRHAAECGAESASVQNQEHWPHNREGFALALAQFELKAGNCQHAEVMLRFAREQESYEHWPQRPMVESLLGDTARIARLYFNEDPADDPPMVLSLGSPVSCRVCHHTAAPTNSAAGR